MLGLLTTVTFHTKIQFKMTWNKLKYFLIIAAGGICVSYYDGKFDSSTTYEDLVNATIYFQNHMKKDGKECNDFKYPGDIYINSFKKDKNLNPLADFHSPPHAILINTICFTAHSFGNDFGFFIENLLCANQTGYHLIAPYFVDTHNGAGMQESEPFLSVLPRYFLHPNPNPHDISEKMRSICKTDMFSHEQTDSFLHSNINVANHYFLEGIQAYWNSIPHEDRTTMPPKIIQEKVSFLNDYNLSEPLPMIPDVAIHYRCGDNTNVGGLLPLKAFNSIFKEISFSIDTIYILSESSNRFKTPDNQRKRCHTILSSLHKHISQLIPHVKVLLIRGDRLFTDLARLTYAKTVICSASTFCYWPALARNKTTYFPRSRLFLGGGTYDYGPYFQWIKEPGVVMFNHAKSDHEVAEAIQNILATS